MSCAAAVDVDLVEAYSVGCADPQPITVDVHNFDFSCPWRFFDADPEFSGDGLDVTDMQIDERVGTGMTLML